MNVVKRKFGLKHKGLQKILQEKGESNRGSEVENSAIRVSHQRIVR